MDGTKQSETLRATQPAGAQQPDGIVHTSAAQDVLEAWFEEIGIDLDADDAKRLFDKMTAAFGAQAPAQQPAPSAAVVFDAQGYRDWVYRNLPDETLVGNGAWWADHLTAWAKRFVKVAPQPSTTPQAGRQPAPQQEAQEPVAVPRFNCWSTNDGDSWFDHPADSQAIYDCLGNNAKVGDEYELKAGWRSVTARYRITEVVGDGEEYEVECVSHQQENTAPHPASQGGCT